jgi:small GTP-binding protein
MSIIKKLLSKIFTSKDEKKNALVLGLDQAGKTTLINFLQTGKYIPERRATRGRSYEQINFGESVEINLCDIGGQKQFRDLWLPEMSKARCVIFVIDSADRERFGEARKELWRVIPELKGRPLIILSNKVDIRGHATESEVVDALGLHSPDAEKYVKKFSIYSTTSKTGNGIVKAFLEVYSILTGDEAVETIEAEFLGIYNYKGDLIYHKTADITVNPDEIYKELNKYRIFEIRQSNRLQFNEKSYIIENSERLELIFVLKVPHARHIDVVDSSRELLSLIAHFEADMTEIQERKVDTYLSDLINQNKTSLVFSTS